MPQATNRKRAMLFNHCRRCPPSRVYADCTDAVYTELGATHNSITANSTNIAIPGSFFSAQGDLRCMRPVYHPWTAVSRYHVRVYKTVRQETPLSRGALNANHQTEIPMKERCDLSLAPRYMRPWGFSLTPLFTHRMRTSLFTSSDSEI